MLRELGDLLVVCEANEGVPHLIDPGVESLFGIQGRAVRVCHAVGGCLLQTTRSTDLCGKLLNCN